MPANILIVDDEPSMLRLYSRFFTEAGHSFALAASLAEARSFLEAGPCNLLITDFNLGDGWGTELIELVNKRGGTATILVSGSLPPEELNAARLKYGIKACFSKPFKSEDLLLAVRELLPPGRSN